VACASPLFLAGAPIPGSGRRVKGLREASARRAALGAAVASGTLGSRGRRPAQHRAYLNEPEYLLSGGGAPVPGGRP
jgi:hypothetical protein